MGLFAMLEFIRFFARRTDRVVIRRGLALAMVLGAFLGMGRFEQLQAVEAGQQTTEAAPVPALKPRVNVKTTVTSAEGKPVKIGAHPGTGVHQGESAEEAQRASTGCVSCHRGIEHPNMHAEDTVALGCADCHGGRADVMSVGEKGSAEYKAAEKNAHVQPRFQQDLENGGHPVRVYTRWLKESYEYIRFVNPGDLRVAPETCGTCHAAETRNVKTSMMTHGAMLWGAALYNNGGYPLKNPHFGESYDIDGKPERLRSFPPPTAEETKMKGVLPYLDPLQRWEGLRAWQYAARVREGRREEVGDRQPGSGRGSRASRIRSSAIVGWEPSFAPIRCSWDCRRRACSILCSTSRARTISQGIIAGQDAQDAMWCMPTIAILRTRRTLRSTGTWARASARIPPSTRISPVIR